VTDTDHGDITEQQRDTVTGYRGGFLNGLCTGALIGAAAGVLFAPWIHAAGREFYGKALKTTARGVEHVNEGATEAQAEPHHRAAVTTPTPP